MKRNEVAKMKKIMFLTMMMVVTLAVGSAYTDGSATWALTQSGSEWSNGITVFTTGPADFENVPLGAGEMRSSYEEGAAAGGWREEETAEVTEPYNGVTIFIAGPVDFETLALGTEVMIGVYEEGSAAGGLHEEEAALAPENGVTIFSDGPVDYERVPAGASW